MSSWPRPAARLVPFALLRTSMSGKLSFPLSTPAGHSVSKNRVEPRRGAAEDRIQDSSVCWAPTIRTTKRKEIVSRSLSTQSRVAADSIGREEHRRIPAAHHARDRLRHAADQKPGSNPKDYPHFLSCPTASAAMRQMLVDHIRRKRAQRRPSSGHRVELHDGLALPSGNGGASAWSTRSNRPFCN